jgi:glucose/mannose transport system substrate-binding protein
MIADAKVLARHNKYIGLGTRDKWTAEDLFDAVLLSVAGANTYEKFYTGLLDVDNDLLVRTAFDKFKELIPYLLPGFDSQAWSDMPGQLGRGDAAMMILGDFAAPLLNSAGYVEGRDWEAVGFPAKPEVFLMVVDTFTRPKNIQHPDATTDWLTNLTSARTQADFTNAKGSIAPSTDVPISNYSKSLQQRAAQAFTTIPVVPSSVHGALAPLSFLDDWADVLTVFIYSPDVDRALQQTSMLMKIGDVAGNSAWYWAP